MELMYLWFITFFNNINFCFARPSPHPGSGTSLDRLNSMSPAARRLASSQLRRRIGSDLALQASYSPSPHSVRSGQASPSLTPSLAKTPTPGKIGRMKKNRLSTPNLNITDNLLNLPTRPRASDFF
jgi:protein DGCR14